MAHRSLGRNRLREWRILLVSDETLSSGRSRLPLGDYISRSACWPGRIPTIRPIEQYPLTAGVFALAVCAPAARNWPPALFWGISSSLLAFGLTRHGYTRLLIFFAYPYWAGILTVQWSPLIAASAFFPLLLPVTMAKPQIGLPVFLTRLSRRGLCGVRRCGLSKSRGAASWPWLWLRSRPGITALLPTACSSRTAAPACPASIP